MRNMIVHFLKMLTCLPAIRNYFKAEAGDRLNFWSVFLGLLIGLLGISRQEAFSANLEARLKSSEIAMVLMEKLAECRSRIASLDATSFSSYERDSLEVLLECRSDFSSPLAGLNVLVNDFSFKKMESKFDILLALDDRMRSTVMQIRRKKINTETFSGQNALAEIMTGMIDHKELPSIQELQEKLKRE